MKKIKLPPWHLLSRLVFIALVLLSAGCTKDPSEGVSSNETKVSLTLTLPSPTTMSSYAIDDDRENEVSRLDAFFLDNAGNVIPNVGHQTIRSFGQAGGTITLSLVLDRSIAEQQLYVVANATDVILDGVTTKDQLDALEFSSARMPRQLFLMSASDVLRPVKDFTNGVSLELTRSVARMDIKLDGAVMNFKIKSAKLINANSHSYAYQKLDNNSKVQSPAGSTKLDYDRVEFTPAEERGFASRLYAYENFNVEATAIENTTSIILGGQYGGSNETTYYLIDVKDQDGALHIVRNNRYEITVTEVTGPGFSNEEEAETGASTNLSYSIEMWKQSDVNVEFDGTLFLSVSERQLQLPRDAFGGTIIVKTNVEGYSISSPVDASGNPASWFSVKKEGDVINYSSPVNSVGVSRTAYFYVTAGSKLKIKVSATQSYGEMSIIKLSATSVVVPIAGTGAAPATALITHGRSNITWTIDPTIAKFGDTGNWVRFLTGQLMTGTGTDSHNDKWELKVVVDPKVGSAPSRSAVVTLKAKDNISGIVEYYKFTVSQLNTEAVTLMPKRWYIAMIDHTKAVPLPIKSNGKWTATQYVGNRHNASLNGMPTVIEFTDSRGVPLTGSVPEKTRTSYTATGDDILYIKPTRSYVNTNLMSVGYVQLASEDGSITHRVRIHCGDYKAVEVNGITMLDRNLGGNNAGPDNRTIPFTLPQAAETQGYRYQWGRVPDGYETTLSYGAISVPPAAFANDATLTSTNGVPMYRNDAANAYSQWGRLISGNNSWIAVTGNTPQDQVEPMRFWDANANIGADAVDIEKTNAVGVRTDFDPCPDGWRVPTAKELRRIFLSTSADGPNYQPCSGYVGIQAGCWVQESKVTPGDVYFPAGGAAIYQGGAYYAPLESSNALISVGSLHNEGYYASSSPAGSRGRFHYLFFDKNKIEMRNDRHPATRATFVTGAMNIRCVKAN